MPSSTNIDVEILATWQLKLLGALTGGFQNQHWLVETPAGEQQVLRRYKENCFADLEYEFEVMRRLGQLDWPIPQLVREPIERAGRTWCLLSKLPGGHCRATGRGEERRRGRLLAEVHQAMQELTPLGQRRGFQLPDAIASDPALLSAIKKLEALRPDDGYLLRWHLERAAEELAALDVAGAEKLVLHGDFVGRNLLFDGDKLTGILDFEATHLNVRAADFAMSWRGCYDEVIRGYEEVHKLDELDWQLLVPVFWSWLFIGLRSWIEQMSADQLQQADISWQIKLLSRRSELFRDLQEPFSQR